MALRDDAIRNWEINLAAVADAAKLAVNRWVDERLADGRVAAEHAAEVPGLFRGANGPASPPSSPAAERLRHHLSLMRREHGYPGAWVVSRSGRVVLQLPGGRPATPAELSVAGRVVQDGAARFGDPSLQSDSTVTLAFAVPVPPRTSRPSGALLVRVDPQQSLFSLLQSGRRLGTTADLRLVVRLGEEVALLTPVANPASRPLALRASWERVSVASQLAIGGAERSGLFTSTSGVPIVAATRYIAATRWGLISRVEQGEAFAAYRARLRGEMLLGALVLSAFTLGFVALTRTARLAQWRDRIAVAAALEASQERYRHLIESSLGLICTHDLQGTILSANPAVARALGLGGPAAMIGRSLEQFLAPAVRSLFSHYLARLQANGMDAGLMRIQTAAGEERIWEYRNTLVREPGREPYALGHARDITDRRRAEEALKRSERSYRTLVEHALYGIYRSTREGRLVAVNPALVRMLGYASEAELLAVDLARDVYVNPDERGRLIDAHREATHLEGIEVDWKRKDGTPIRVRLSGSPMRDEQGELEGFEMIVEDITERRALEAQLRHAQKLEAVGQLTGGIAHDFNNLLTVILANADLIANVDPPLASELRGDVEDLQGAARRGAELVRKLLAFSRREELRVRPVNLSRLVSDLAGVLRRLVPEHITLESRLPSQVSPVLADPGAVEQVLLNLVTNARDAMPGGGALSIGIAEAVIDSTYRSAHGWGEPGRYVRLSVRDTGTGMDDVTLAHLFEPFFTTKPAGIGTGLGMAMVYGLVKQQDGFIDVQTRKDHGTAVDVYLPVAPPADAGAPSPDGNQLVGTETILLVEDEEGIRRSAGRILSRAGYQVLFAGDGEEALAVYRRRQADIQLVISDVVMPRVSGQQLYEALHRGPGHPKFIFTSGYASREVHDREVLERAGPMLQKPWSAEELLRRVRQALDG